MSNLGIFRWLLLLTSALIFTACERQVSIIDSDFVGPAFTPSGELRPVRLAMPEALVSVVSAGPIEPLMQPASGASIPLICCDEQGHWSGDVNVDAEDNWRGTLSWVASPTTDAVVLLQRELTLQLPADSPAPDISPSSYERGVDDDNDGVDNLTEIVLGTDPADSSDMNEEFLSATVRVPRIATAGKPIIDGEAGQFEHGTTQLQGEWANAVSVNTLGELLNIDTLMYPAIDFDAEYGNHHWRAMHDGEWLYLLVIVDDNGKHHFDSKDTEFPWKDDSIEIYFDGDNSQEPNYDEVDDRGIAVVLFDWDDGTANASINAEPKVFPTLNSLPLPAGLEFATGPLQGPTPPLLEAVSTLPPDVYEIALLISDLNIMLGHTFGFEVQVLDDDDGGDRDAKWGWHHPRGDSPDNDFTWRDPRFMGRLVLLP